MVAIAVGGSLAATQAKAASTTPAAARAGGGLSVSKQFFGTDRRAVHRQANTAVFRYTLSNARGMSVQILTYGGIVQEYLGAGQERPVGRRGARLQDPGGLRQVRQPAGGPDHRRVLRRDRRPVRQPDRQRHVHPEPARPVGPVKYTCPRQQRAERPARRDRRLRQPHLGRPAGLRSWLRRRAAHPGQPERRRGRRRRVPRLPERLHRLPGPDQGRPDLHPEQRQPACPALHDHQPVHEPQHGPQPDQPQLLQPGRRELVPRLGLRPDHHGSTPTSTRRPTPPRSRSATWRRCSARR